MVIVVIVVVVVIVIIIFILCDIVFVNISYLCENIALLFIL